MNSMPPRKKELTALSEREEKIKDLMGPSKGQQLRVGIVDPIDGSVFERIWAIQDRDGRIYCTNQPLVFGCWGMLIKTREGKAYIQDQDEEVRADWRALMACIDPPRTGWWARFLHGPGGDPLEDYSKLDDAGNEKT